MIFFLEIITDKNGTAKIRPDQRIVYIRNLNTPDAKLEGGRKILENLVLMVR